ncbi:MAG: TlpA disulfide reductase family protein [Saprospiraceae bacterium]
MSLMVHPFRPSLVCIYFAAFLCASPLRAQKLVVYDNLEQLQSRISRAGDTTLVLNFWATWCIPCVEELHYFDVLQENYGSQNVQVVLVSLDFKSNIEKKVLPLLKRKQLKSEVALMADQDLNAWIPMIYEGWDGGIPATLVMQGKKRLFKSGKFANPVELDSFVRPLILDSEVFVAQKKTCKDISGGKK